jgi:hypothetical protein
VTSVSGSAEAPIFVVGFGRSGTTLLASMLNAHGNVACGPETGFLDLVDRTGGRAVVADARWPEAATRWVAGLRRPSGQSVMESYGVTIDEVRAELAARPPSVAALLESLTVPFARARGKSRWAEKTPRHLVHAETLRRHWPDAVVVRIVRDPRGVVAGYRSVPFGRSTTIGVAYHWRDFDDETWRFFERDGRSTTVRFEDLVSEPERELRRLCERIGEPFDPRMLFPGEASGDVIAEGEWWKERVRTAIDPGRATAWRDELPRADQSRVAVICADGLRRYGFEPEARRSRPVRVQPIDGALLADEESVGTAADRGLVFVAGAGRWPLRGRARPILWGGPGQLRWRRGTLPATVLSLARAGTVMVLGRLRRDPVIWVDATTPRERRGTVADRVGDALARRLARRTTPREWLALTAGSAVARARRPGADEGPTAP